MPGSFVDVLTRFVREFEKKGGKKQDVARKTGFSAGWLSHLLAGRSIPERDTIIRLGTALQLKNVESFDEMLRAAQWEPLKPEEIALELPEQVSRERIAQATVQGLEAPERDLFKQAVREDVDLIRKAWDHHVATRDTLYRRDWALVNKQFQSGRESYYWALRRTSARYLAHLCLAQASALEHQDRPDEAESVCLDGLRAAETAGDPMARCMLLVRLAGIEKLSGQFAKADAHYKSGVTVLSEWESTQPLLPAREWCAHWRERIRRMQGSLYLFQGNANKAYMVLQQSHAYFERQQHTYERSQVCYSLGWACNLLGAWDLALRYHQQGLALTRQLNTDRSEWEDVRSLLQGYLYVGGDYLDRHEYGLAASHLKEAKSVANTDNGTWETYHEAGRIYLLLGKLSGALGNWNDAKRDIERGLNFYRTRRDPVRLASAFNMRGDLYLAQGEVEDALAAYRNALVWASKADPPAHYYRTAASLNCLRALLKADETTVEVVEELPKVKQLCLEGNYWQHLARLKVVEAELMARQRDQNGATVAVREAFDVASRFNRFLVDEVYTGLEQLQVADPEELATLRAGAIAIAEQQQIMGR